MAQTDASSYGFSLDVAQAGQKADLAFDDVNSFAAEGSIEFGFGVVAGTDPVKQVATASASSDTFRGIAVFTHKQTQGIDLAASAGGLYSTGAEYRDTDTVNVLRKGRVWVELTADGVEAGDDAYVDVLTVGEEGKFTNVATDNLATGGIFRTGGDTGELAILEINLP